MPFVNSFVPTIIIRIIDSDAEIPPLRLEQLLDLRHAHELRLVAELALLPIVALSEHHAELLLVVARPAESEVGRFAIRLDELQLVAPFAPELRTAICFSVIFLCVTQFRQFRI